jgi:putative transcriptional regulator
VSKRRIELGVRKLRYWLVEKRNKFKLSQGEVARLAGIHRGSYTNIELGRRNPSVRVAKKIGAVLEFDWTIFFDKKRVEMKRMGEKKNEQQAC